MLAQTELLVTVICSFLMIKISFFLMCDRYGKSQKGMYTFQSGWFPNGIYTFLSVFVFLLYDYQAIPVVKINRAFPDALCFNHLLLWHEKSTLTYYWLKCFVKQLLNYLSVRQTWILRSIRLFIYSCTLVSFLVLP